jgi:hypothetical protein
VKEILGAHPDALLYPVILGGSEGPEAGDRLIADYVADVRERVLVELERPPFRVQHPEHIAWELLTARPNWSTVARGHPE